MKTKHSLNIKKTRGFTLVELLVIVAVLALLGASLLPSVAALRAKAAQARCANNLRILGAAWNTCADDYGGWLLPASFPSKEVVGLPEGCPSNAVQPGIWWSKLAGYLPPEAFQGNQNVFSCPGDAKPVKANLNAKPLLLSYGYPDYFGYPYESNPQWATCNAYGLHRRKNTKKPGATPVLIEMADYPGGKDSGSSISEHKNSRMIVQAGGYGRELSAWMAFRHCGLANVLFDDGHVEAVNADNPVSHSKAEDFF